MTTTMHMALTTRGHVPNCDGAIVQRSFEKPQSGSSRGAAPFVKLRKFISPTRVPAARNVHNLPARNKLEHLRLDELATVARHGALGATPCGEVGRPLGTASML